MQAYRALEPDCDEPVQFCAASVWRWQPEWGEPKLLFREMTTAELAQTDEVKALIEACHWWLETGRFLASSSPRKAAGILRTDGALAPFTEAPDAVS